MTQRSPVSLLTVFSVTIAVVCSILLTLLTIAPPQVNPDWALLDAAGVYIPKTEPYPWPNYAIQVMLVVTIVGLVLMMTEQNRPPVSSRDQNRKRSFSKTALALVGLTLLGFGLRVHAITTLPLVADEVSLATFASNILYGQHIPVLGVGQNANPVLYSWLMAGVMQYIGQNVLGVRLLALIFGVLTIPAVYVFGRAWWSGRVGLVAAAFVTTYPAHIFFSRMSLYTIADPFWSCLALTFLARGMRRNNRRDYVLAGLCAAASQYFYHGSRLLVILMIVYVLVAHLKPHPQPLSQTERGAKRLVKQIVHAKQFVRQQAHLSWLLLAFGLVTLPRWATFVAYHLPISGNANASTLMLLPHWEQHIGRAFLAWVNAPDTSLYWLGSNMLLPSLTLIAFLTGIAVSLGRWRDARSVVLLTSILLTTIVGGGIFETALLYIRYTMALPALTILVALGVEQVSSSLERCFPALVKRVAFSQQLPHVLIVQIVVGLICLQGVIEAGLHTAESPTLITQSHWQQDALVRQAARLPAGTAAVFVVPRDFGQLELLTFPDYVAVYGERRAVVVNKDDPEALAEQVGRLGGEYQILKAQDLP